jgi:hypothetical protein
MASEDACFQAPTSGFVDVSVTRSDGESQMRMPEPDGQQHPLMAVQRR